jgi:hypothetical protein
VALSNEDISKVMPSGNIELKPDEIRDITPQVLDEDGRITVLPAAFWKATTVEERALFGHRNGIYSFPTVELVERLTEIIADRSAIEIAAGHGVLAEALGIPGTDNYQQRMPKYRFVYEMTKQPIVPYGPNLVDMNASRAVRRYKPEVVIGAWVTHKFDPAHHERGGNEIGVDMRDILLHCETFVLIGNETTHALNPIWDRRVYEIEYPDWLFSRAHNGSREFIATFPGISRGRR